MRGFDALCYKYFIYSAGSPAVPAVQYQFQVPPSLIIKKKDNNPLSNIQNMMSQSIPQQSSTSDPLPNRRKRTATERAENNGDPLIAKKKARHAKKTALPSSIAPTQAAAAKKRPNVNLY
jgi:hypothetical protein